MITWIVHRRRRPAAALRRLPSTMGWCAFARWSAKAFSGITVQLRRRADLIPNLVETVKGYATHERETFEAITAQRAAATSAGGVAATAQADAAMTGLLGRLMVVAEAYPELKADANFRQLQAELSAIENELQSARRYYNATARDLNTKVDILPRHVLRRPDGVQGRALLRGCRRQHPERAQGRFRPPGLTSMRRIPRRARRALRPPSSPGRGGGRAHPVVRQPGRDPERLTGGVDMIDWLDRPVLGNPQLRAAHYRKRRAVRRARRRPRYRPHLPAGQMAALTGLARLIASGFGSGYAPKAPGTVGSLAALALGWGLLHGPAWALPAAILLACVAGWWAIRAAGGADDPGWVVMTDSPASGLRCCPRPPLAARPARRVRAVPAAGHHQAGPDRLGGLEHGPLGVMADDVIAGGIAAVVLWIASEVFFL